MRTIKFRAWDLKKMHYPTIFEFGINEWNGKAFVAIPLPHGGKLITSLLMEYINMNDKDGKEIYEEDIVEVSRYENDERYIVVVKDIRNIPELMRGSSVNWIKVIGNTYENPRLTNNPDL